MRTAIILTGLITAAVSVGAAAQKPAKAPAAKPAQRTPCPMCARMMSQPGMAGMSGMGGMMDPERMARMHQMMMPGSVTVSNDGAVYVLRGGTLYKYDSSLNLQSRAQLPAPAMQPTAGAAAQSAREGHHP